MNHQTVNRKTIALFGSYKPRPNEPAYEMAQQIGMQLGQAGFDLINGGHDGTMAASARGAREAGAHVTGVTCAAVQTARSIAVNRYCHDVIEAPDLFARIETMMRRAGGYVVMEGGTGTLAELGLVWEHVNKRFIVPRPIVCVGHFWKPTIEAVAGAYRGADGAVHVVQTADEVTRIMREDAICPDPHDQSWTPLNDRSTTRSHHG